MMLLTSGRLDTLWFFTLLNVEWEENFLGHKNPGLRLVRFLNHERSTCTKTMTPIQLLFDASTILPAPLSVSLLWSLVGWSGQGYLKRTYKYIPTTTITHKFNK